MAEQKGMDPRASRLSNRSGEIVEASTTRLRAVAPRAFEAPAFGSFVRTSDNARIVYGVVSHVEHASIDPSRRAIPLGRTWDELRREQPQVLELLTTEFEAICVAFAEPAGWSEATPSEARIHAYLPPIPPRIHDFVEPCAPDEINALTDDLSFIRTLGATGLPVVGELIAAAIRSAAVHRADTEGFRVRAGREVADLFRQDHELMLSIIRRIRAVEPSVSKTNR
ncbi:MAG: hypothetical protein WD826_07005 [Actinomycetota bacterium]